MLSINTSQLLIAIPVLGVALGFLFRKTALGLNTWFLIITTLALLAPLIISETALKPWATPLVLLIGFGGCLSVLGRPIEADPSFDLFEILILMGLGFGFIGSPPPLGFIFLGGIFSILILMQLRTMERSASETRWLIGLYGTAILLLVTSSSFAPQHQNIALALVYATLLPLFPLHGAYTILLKRLPGTLPAFLSIFLPALGLYGLLPLLPTLPPEIKQIFLFCAIFGMTIGALRSLVQIRLAHILAQIALIFWSILWWYLTDSEVTTSAVLLFLSAAALALSGLFLIEHSLKVRYGDLIIDQFSGLASVMPRFSVFFILLCMAAMGLPLFGVFSGFITMSFSSVSSLSGSLVFVLLAWLLASWRFPTLMESLLFGLPKPHWVYQDFGIRETTALTLILIVLFILGISPHILLDPEYLPDFSKTSLGIRSW